MLPVQQPAPAILIVLGAICFIPLCYGLFIATPGLTLFYLGYIGLLLIGGYCLIWSLVLATNKIVITDQKIIKKSLFGATDIEYKDIKAIAFWADRSNWQESSYGSVVVQLENELRRVNVSYEKMGDLMPRLMAECPRAVLIDCDEGEVDLSDTGSQYLQYDLDELRDYLSRVFRNQMIVYASILAFIVVLGVVIWSKNNFQPLRSEDAVWLIPIVPVIYRGWQAYAWLRRVNAISFPMVEEV